MKLSDDQRSAVEHTKNLVLSSCPGSGKTRTIIAKILRCLNDVRDTPRRIGCITYTNAATHEIISRLAETGASGDDQYVEVNTIHSFCLNNIVRPYAYLLPELSGEFQVASPDSTWFQGTVDTLIKKYDLPRRVADLFANIQRRLDGQPVAPDGIPQAAAEEFCALAKHDHILTFSDIVYFAYLITTQHPFVARALSCRFAWLLVDEFQDTSELQVELLCAVYQMHNTRFFVVGDENQSIYAFAGAKPELMADIARRISADTHISLTGNFRCSTKIVAVAERLCPRTPVMKALGVSKDFDFEPRHVTAASPAEALLGHFFPTIERLGIRYGDAAVLSPWWPPLFKLSRILRDRGIPIIGPGARPYKRSLEFSQFAEAAAACVVCDDLTSATTIQRALFFMLMQVNSEPDWRVFGYAGKKILCALLREAKRLSHDPIGATEWIRCFAEATAHLLKDEDMITSLGAETLVHSASTMISSIEDNVADPKNMAIEDLGIFARPDECAHLMTLHASKGREFEAVAVIDFHEGRVPHFKADASGIAEARRLTYVAATRAKKIVVFYSDKSDIRNKPSRFIAAMGI